MLIGPTITLSTLEKCIANKRVELKTKENELYDRTNELQVILRTEKSSKYENGKRVANPEYTKAFNEFEEIRALIEKNKAAQTTLKIKANELETIEIEAREAGQHFVKSEKRITLTLADAEFYGVTSDDIAKDNEENAK